MSNHQWTEALSNFCDAGGIRKFPGDVREKVCLPVLKFQQVELNVFRSQPRLGKLFTGKMTYLLQATIQIVPGLIPCVARETFLRILFSELHLV